MAGPYTLKKLTEVKDSAAEFGIGDVQEGRFANDDLDVQQTGLSHHRLHAGKRQGFGHKHENAEEVYSCSRARAASSSTTRSSRSTRSMRSASHPG